MLMLSALLWRIHRGFVILNGAMLLNWSLGFKKKKGSENGQNVGPLNFPLVLVHSGFRVEVVSSACQELNV